MKVSWLIRSLCSQLMHTDHEAEGIDVYPQNKETLAQDITYENGKVTLLLSNEAKLDRLTLTGFHPVVTGMQYFSSQSLRVSLPSGLIYRLSQSGKSVLIGPRYARASSATREPILSLWLITSIMVHLGVLGLFLLIPPQGAPVTNEDLKLIAQSRQPKVADPFDDAVPMIEGESTLTAGMGGLPGMARALNFGAFRGRSVLQTPAEFLATRSKEDASRLRSLSDRLARLRGVPLSQDTAASLGQLSEKSLQQALQSAAKGLGQAGKPGTASGSGSGGQPASQMIRFANPKGAQELSPEAEARVRRVFAELHPKFVTAFESARETDPSLSLSLVYQGIVQANGKLGAISFRARGTYSHSGLMRLQNELRQILLQIVIGTDLQGVSIRGERLFVQ